MLTADGHPVRTHDDKRRVMWGDVFPASVVEVNVCSIQAGAYAGSWHGHARQDDYWFVAAGRLFCGLKTDEFEKVVEMVPGDMVHIPAGWWHTYFAPEDCVLIYGLTNRWDGTDELRLPYSGDFF